MSTIPDFTDSELWSIQTTLRERYGRDIEVMLADSEVRLRADEATLSTCPTAYWEMERCHFVVIKTGPQRYRCQFYYRLYEMFGTGIDEFDDLSECMVTLLQVQADHHVNREGTFPAHS